MLKIRRPLGRLIFNMGIAIPGKTVFLIETAPWLLKSPGHQKPCAEKMYSGLSWGFPPPAPAQCKKNIKNENIWWYICSNHYSNVIMSSMASQITSVDISMVCSTVCSDADQRKHQSSASLVFVRGIHGWPANSPHKGPVTRKCFHLMTSSCVTSAARVEYLVNCVCVCVFHFNLAMPLLFQFHHSSATQSLACRFGLTNWGRVTYMRQ